MDFSDPIARSALVVAVLMLLTLLVARRRSPRAAPPRREALDTVAGWPPEAARVLTVSEREAYELLKRALPGFLVLAQVPLARFLRVPTHNAYGEWMQRVGNLNADLVLCDGSSRVLAVVDVRAAQESERSRRRHERLARVLKAAGIGVHVWREGELPTLAAVRSSFVGAMDAVAPRPAAAAPRPVIPVAEVEELLAAGDRAVFERSPGGSQDPVPSAFFDDMEPARR